VIIGILSFIGGCLLRIGVEIGVPRTCGRKRSMTPTRSDWPTVGAGFESMIELLQRNKRSINAGALRFDWSKMRDAYLSSRG